MVLQTTHSTDDGATLVVTDCFTLHNGAMLPWVELVRHLHCERGTLAVRWDFEPNLLLGATPQPMRAWRGFLRAEAGKLRIGLLHWGAGDPEPTPRGAGSRCTMVAGDDALLAAVAVVDEPLPHPDRGEVMTRIDRTIQTWGTWSEGIEYTGRWSDQVHQSARVLKLLTHEPDGAIMAAATTSLPERIGGDRNYDYRYCWIRDASFTIDAYLRIGLVEEAHRAIVALLRMATTTAPHLAPFYEVDVGIPLGEEHLDTPGYRRSTPVRIGNRAATQLQLGNWGDLFEAMWIYVRQENDLDAETAALMASLADHVCEIWTEEDAGIWELPEPRHYTISKMGCWVALDRALRMIDADQIDGDAERWKSTRRQIRTFVDERCWSEDQRSYTAHADTEDLDAATLIAARTGFVEGTDERMRGTIDAVRRSLTDGPFVWRYTGHRDLEGAFVPCSFWLADALIRADRLDNAADQIDGTLEAMTDLGLLAEEYDPSTGELLGNVPQGLSHLALVTAASLYTEAIESTGPGPDRSR